MLIEIAVTVLKIFGNIILVRNMQENRTPVKAVQMSEMFQKTINPKE